MHVVWYLDQERKGLISKGKRVQGWVGGKVDSVRYQ